MRALGHLFLWGGFLAASFLSVRIADRVEWPLYGAAVAVATLGVVLLRLSSRRAGLETDKLNANSTILSASLERLTTQIDALLAARETTDVFSVHGRIDAELVAPLNAFVAARESMIHLYGLQPYAEVMTRFAGSERMLNRAWSASADGYIDEVWKCVEIALVEMRAARTKLTALVEAHAAATRASQ